MFEHVQHVKKAIQELDEAIWAVQNMPGDQTSWVETSEGRTHEVDILLGICDGILREIIDGRIFPAPSRTDETEGYEGQEAIL